MLIKISRQIRERHPLKMMRLVEFNIQPCRVCYGCPVIGRCVIQDDHRQIVEAIALVVAAPTYFLGAHCTLNAMGKHSGSSSPGRKK